MIWTRETEAEQLRHARQEMLLRHLKGRDIRDSRVLLAMESIPREKFLPPDYLQSAYSDCPLPIGYGQTISQPYIVALMAQALEIGRGERILEIGTGCGYQAAVLSLLCEHVYTMEIVAPLAKEAKNRLATLGYDNITVIHADGTHGWPEHAPYQKIIAAATARKPPPDLETQLAEGGKIVLPIGDFIMQDLVLGEKKGGKVSYTTVTLVRFVPMMGDAQEL